jgi:hypothetical protein
MARGAGAALATLAVFAFAGPAAAATPQDIYRDLADNGRLDKHYSRADINRALHSPSLRRYEGPSRPPSTAKPVAAPAPPSAAADSPGTLPFSGLDLALFGVVGAPLLLLGASLGRVARVRAGEELQ